MYGITPREYLLNIRVKAAKEFLALTDLPIAQIAENCGFCDSKNLILNFKKATHMTPGRYRKLNRL
jgi:transcriptional regulator GlxA family with amidase domain